MGLLDWLSGDNGTPQTAAPPSRMADLGSLTNDAPALTYQQWRDNNRAASLLGGFNQSLLSGIIGMASDTGPQDYAKYLAQLQGLKSANNANTLGDYDVAAYGRQQPNMGPGAAPAAAMPPQGAPRSDGQPAPALPGPFAAGGATPGGASLLGGTAPVAGLLGAPSSGAASPDAPLFDVGAMRAQLGNALSSPRMAAVAPAILSLLEKGVPEGGYLTQGGGIGSRPGYNNFVGAKSAAEAGGSAPAKAFIALMDRAGQVHNIGPNDKAVTGLQAIPGLQETFQRLISGGSLGPGGATQAPAAAAGGPQRQPAPIAPPAGSPAPSARASASQPPPGIDPGLWSEVPTMKLPDSPDRGPGGIMQGISSAQLNMQERANKQKEEIDARGAAANQTRASLATLAGTLDSGQFNSNATAPVRATISAYVSALTDNRDLAKSITGIDPAAAQLFNKDATRMGLQFARQTEGAREAVQAIKIALGANPSMATQLEANKMIVQIMDRAAQYDGVTQSASDAFYFKNGHNVGFDGWWNRTHPSTDYTTGKANPYSVPMIQGGGVDTKMLVPGFTYRSPDGKIGTWTGAGFKTAQ